MRKEERHQIKRDELVNVLERTTWYLADPRHLRRVIAAAAAIVLLVAGGLGARAWLAGREEKASYLLGQIIQAYRAPAAVSLEALQQATPGTKTYASPQERDEEVIALADRLLGEYGGTRAAARGTYYKGLALAGLQRHDEAARVLAEFIETHPGDFLAPMARYRLALLNEERGNPAEALIHFQTLVDDSRGLFPKEEALMGMARCQEASGRRDEALATYRKLVAEHPDSDYRAEADRRIQDLS